jgi:hypothetical protein
MTLSDTSSAAVEFHDVRLSLGTARFHFDCRIGTGHITAVTGPSGSGKSTLLNLVAGFETPDGGRVLLSGKDMSGVHPGQRPLSLVFQDNNLFAHLDLFTNVGLGIHPALKLSPGDRRAVSDALQRVGLAGYETRKPGTLSIPPFGFPWQTCCWTCIAKAATRSSSSPMTGTRWRGWPTACSRWKTALFINTPAPGMSGLHATIVSANLTARHKASINSPHFRRAAVRCRNAKEGWNDCL